MTAYEAMADILNINEGVEYLKSKNTDSVPDKDICNIVDTLLRYRDILVECMVNTQLNIGE